MLDRLSGNAVSPAANAAFGDSSGHWAQAAIERAHATGWVGGYADALDQRGKDDDVRAFSLHPGSIVGTGLEKHLLGGAASGQRQRLVRDEPAA